MQKFNLAIITIALTASTLAYRAEAEEAIIVPAEYSDKVVAEFNAGIGASGADKYAEAIVHFQSVCDEQPKFAEAHAMLGFSLLRMGKLQEAAAELSKAHEIKPNQAMVLVNLGSVRQMQGQLPEAAELFQKYLRLYPKAEHVAKVSAMLATLDKEMKRRAVTPVSIGQKDYFAEATASGRAKWSSGKMPIAVCIQPPAGVKGFKDKYPKFLKQAFSQWAEGTAGVIKFNFVDTAPEFGIVCTWIDNPAELKNTMEGGESVISAYPNGDIAKARIKILTSNSATGTPSEDSQFLSICLHEIGHALGLRAHSSQKGDVMFGFVSLPPVEALSERDKATIQKLYAEPLEKIVAPPTRQ